MTVYFQCFFVIDSDCLRNVHIVWIVVVGWVCGEWFWSVGLGVVVVLKGVAVLQVARKCDSVNQYLRRGYRCYLTLIDPLLRRQRDGGARARTHFSTSE